MKLARVKAVASILIFLTMTALTYALVKPVYESLGNFVRSQTQALNLVLENKYGVKAAYASMSPSVISGITLKGIEVSDVASGTTLVSVKRARLSFSIWKLLRKDFMNALKDLTASDVDVTLQMGSNSSWLEKITENSENQNKTREHKVSFTELLKNKELEINLPCNVYFYNIKADYENKGTSVQALVRKLSLEKTSVDGKYDAQLVGSVSALLNGYRASSTVYFQSSLNSHIDNSSAVIHLVNTSAKDISVSQIGFYAEYHDLMFSFKMLPSVKSIYLECSADLEKSDINVFLDTNRFYISNLVNVSKKNELISSLQSLMISVNARLNYNFDSGFINYKSKGNVSIPESLVPGSLDLTFDLNGTKNYINVPYLKGVGELYDFEFNGGYNIPGKQPQGSFNVYKAKLPNGNEISTELYFEPLRRGFMCFAPQIMFGEKSLTAAQLNFVPNGNEFQFDFEISDYAHYENEKPAVLKLAGSYQTQTKYLQANTSVDTFYVDSILELAAFFLEKNQAGLVTDISRTFRNTIFTTDIFISSYGKDFSYSIPYAIMADTLNSDQMVVLALDGNRDTIALTKFDLNFASQKIRAQAKSENIKDPYSRDRQTIINGQLEYNSIPYNFSGLLNKDWISISGDYGFNFSLTSDKENDELIGSFALKEFPVRLTDRQTLAFNVDTNFSYDVTNRMNIDIKTFEIQSMSLMSNINPTFAFNGFMDKTGIFLNQIGYSDSFSSLLGSGTVLWTFADAEFVNAQVNLMVSDPLVAEELSLTASVSNPEKKPFTTTNFVQDYYVTSALKIKSFRTNRFIPESNPADTINADLTLNGTLSNPFVSISLPRGTMTVNGAPLVITASAVVEDKEFELQSADIDYKFTHVNDIKAKFSFKEWKGQAGCKLSTYAMNSPLSASFLLTVQGLRPDSSVTKGIPEVWDIDFSTKKIDGEFIKDSQPLFIHALSSPEHILITSSPNIGLTGSVLNNGDMKLSIHNGIPFNMEVSGNIRAKNVNLSFTEIDANLGNTLAYFNIPIIKVHGGHLTGAFSIIGPKNDVGYYGELKVTPAEISLPQYFKGKAKAPELILKMNYNFMTTGPVHALLKRSPVDIVCNLQFNNLLPETFAIYVKTVGDTYAPMNINMDQVHIKGNAKIDLEILIEPQEYQCSVVGDIVAKDTNCELGTSRINEVVTAFIKKKSFTDSTADMSEVPVMMPVHVMLNITAENRVQVSFSSFIRGVVVPDNSIVFTLSTDTEKVGIVGNIPLKSGEIIYLNNAFYIKEGLLEFPPGTDGIDPYISLQAETRVYDDKNEEVTIGLKVTHQRITELAPVLTAAPAQSEKKIMELLGHIVSANSDDMGSFMLATGDFALQLMVIRRIENALRDFFNFDILSLRTSVVQNALKQTFERSRSEVVKIGNYLNNTSVYIGKYFGNALYSDFMLRLVYDKNRLYDPTTLKGLMFKPEFGFEMASPIGNIRASLAPDISQLLNQQLGLKPSLTMSWKFNF